MLNKIRIAVVIVSLIIIVIGVMSFNEKGKELEALREKEASINIPEKKTVSAEFTQDDVKRYEKLVNKKLQDFQQHDLSEGEFNLDNEGVNIVRFIFSPPGGKIITDKDSIKKYVEHYSKFTFNVSDVTAKPDGADGAEVYFKIEVKQDGAKVNPQYSLAKLQFNEDDELVGGSLYEQQ
ncbi:hypothetical protein [Staphylococcus chromogenes]|uniref:hypothetical protein n=1 Tax=Staphylococcus chromogenes TaxID=46126 RepID=UPI0018901B8A|nr:hypothetical protein [Staphylococcus chromogenes]